MDLEFEWDDAKAETNRKKHGVDFSEAMHVFFDRHRIERIDPRGDSSEDRFVTTGTAMGRLFTIVYTDRGDTIRIFSARQATPAERRLYHES